MTKVVILLDFPGKTDLVTKSLLSGSSGKLFWDAWNSSPLKWEYDKEVWSVLSKRPGDGKIESFCVSKKEAEEITGKGNYPYSYIKSGKWLHPRWFPELDLLKKKLELAKPNLVICLGALATWAMIGDARITLHRGTCSQGLAGCKCLPTINPQTLMRAWDQYPVLAADLLKASREKEFPECRRPRRKILVPETRLDLDLCTSILEKSSNLSLDIETIPSAKQITCVGFGQGDKLGIVFPFTDSRKPNGNYWENPQDEIHAWECIKKICKNPRIKKTLQNGVYDIQWLWRICNIPVLGFEDDTMLMHHCLFPEMPKSLGFLGSIYTNEASWKLMRKYSEKEVK